MSFATPMDPSWFRLSYRGESMWGTFRAGDVLWICPVAFDSLLVGDVVAFGFRGKSIAHRIVARDGRGFRTQGDGSACRDALPLVPSDLIGKVMARERRGLRSMVAGGGAGRRRRAALRGLGLVRMILGSLLAPPYRVIRASRLAGRFWQPRVTTARFASRGGIITKFIHRGNTVASWIPEAGEWTCRKPYDLVLFPPSR